MPFALLVLSGYDQAADAPLWIGYSSAALAFLLVGAGVHTVQTVGLALATDLVPVEEQPKVVGLMYVMLLVGMIAAALIFGYLLQDYTPGKLVQVVQGAAVVTIALNLLALWKQEPRDRARAARMETETHADFIDAWRLFVRGKTAVGLLVVIALGTMGFGMADVLLEPYGGQVLDLSVAMTTRLTAVLALGGLIGFAIASRVLLNGRDPIDVASLGTLAGIPAFAAIIAAGPLGEPALFRGRHVACRAWRRSFRSWHADGHDAQRPARAGGPCRSAPGARCRRPPPGSPWRSVGSSATSSPPCRVPRPSAPRRPIRPSSRSSFFSCLPLFFAITLLRARQARQQSQTTPMSNRGARPDVPAAPTETALHSTGRTERETHDDTRLTAL